MRNRVLTALATSLFLFPTVYLPYYADGQPPTTIAFSDGVDTVERQAQANSIHSELMRLFNYKRENGEDLRRFQ